MQRLVSLGILSRNTTSHTSPVMLITRKITKDKRPVVDFRLLNTRIKRHNTTTPLMRDICQMLGKAQSKILSCVDLKDAFHSLKLTERAKDFCGILPYFGSHHYRYEVMPMGLSISPCKWIQYIDFVMEKLPYPQNYIAIMDDLLVHSKEEDHMDRILDMLRALVEHGLKLSPKKCQFFRDELVYMGNIFKTSNDGITITPIKTRQEAILKTPTPTTPKECKSFCGVVNYVSLFCPHLQSLLAPIYDLLEAQIEAMFRAPEPEDFILPPALSEHAKGKTMVAQNLPKQSDIDKLMKQLNRKILTQTRFPSSLKDLEAAYCNSAAFKDIYQFLRYNKLPTNRRLAKRIEANALDYYVLGTLLFKYVHQKSGDVEAVLCIPPSKIDLILDMYHGTLIGGHQGMNKTLRTLSSRYYCPRLADYIRAYIVGCHTCQLFKNSKRFHRPLQKRTYDISQPALANVSMVIKYMPKSNKGYKYMVVILCEITNFLVTHPLKEVTASEVCRILVEEFIAYFSTPVRIVCDQDPAFMSSLCRYCFQQYKIQILTVGVTNHKSLQAEHGIKSLSNLILTHLTGLGRDWHIYAKPCMLTYNLFSTPNLDGFCPFELVFGRKPRIVPILEVTPPVPVTGTFKDAYDLLNKRFKYFREMLIKFRDKRFEIMNRDREFQGYTSGQLVYLFCPSNSTLATNRRKFTCQFVGPLAIWKCFSPTQFVLMSLDGVVYPYLVEETRLKPGVIRTTKGNVFTLPALRQMVKSGYMLKNTSSF